MGIFKPKYLSMKLVGRISCEMVSQAVRFAAEQGKRAEYETRTRDTDFGKVVLYQLS